MSTRNVPWQARWATSAPSSAASTASTRAASPPKALADGYTDDSAASSASAPGNPGPAARTTRRWSSGPDAAPTERRAGTTDTGRSSQEGSAAHGSACSGPVGQRTRASGRRPPASNGATSVRSSCAAASSSERSAAACTGAGPPAAGQPAQREQRRADEAVDVGHAGTEVRREAGPATEHPDRTEAAVELEVDEERRPTERLAQRRPVQPVPGSRDRSGSPGSTSPRPDAHLQLGHGAACRGRVVALCGGLVEPGRGRPERGQLARQLLVAVVRRAEVQRGTPPQVEETQHRPRVAGVDGDAQPQLGERGAVARGPDAQLRGAHQRLEAGDGVQSCLDGTTRGPTASAVEAVDSLGVPPA